MIGIKDHIKKVDDKLFKGNFQKIWRKFIKGIEVPANERYKAQTEEFYADSSIRSQLQNVDPKRLSCSDRLDIIVRYLLFRDIVWGNISEAHYSIYCRTILARTGGVEPDSFFSERGGQRDMEGHISAAKELCESMKRDGFREEYYVPIANDYGLYNGAHRLACAMALDENVWVRKCGEQGIRDMDFQWFCDNGFSTEDKVRILRGFADVHHDCGILVLYGCCREKWSYMEKRIGHEMKIVGAVDLDFRNDYVAFENMIHDIYHDYDEKSYIGEKINLLKFAELVVRIILVSDERAPEADLYESIRKTKQELRKLLNYDYPEGAYVTLHGSDSHEEFESLKQIILSENNLKHLGMRMKTSVRKEFLGWLCQFKSYCAEHGIDTDDTCIVGSSPLEVVGIRESTDIDIMISAELRNIYGDGITKLTPILDIGTRNYVRDEKKYGANGVLIKDEQLIYDENCHFMFMGLKFANIEYVHYRKSSSDRDKDIRDVKLIRIFQEYVRHFDDKKILKQQIEKELERRALVEKSLWKRIVKRLSH